MKLFSSRMSTFGLFGPLFFFLYLKEVLFLLIAESILVISRVMPAKLFINGSPSEKEVKTSIQCEESNKRWLGIYIKKK
uniref:Uncharacterized protein n=1 Tax=Rhodnius prolixus TaxID=13249 RepID=T1HXT2_RHOPR